MMRTIDERFWKGSQSLNYTRIVSAGDRRFRVTIKRDSYDNQSYARVEAWTDSAGWALVHSLPLGDCEHRSASHHDRQWEQRIDLFRATAVELLAVAAQVTGGADTGNTLATSDL